MGLGYLPGGTYSSANAVSADGQVVVGDGGNSPSGEFRAFRWTAGEGMEDLGTLPDTTWSTATALSADGSVIVGTSHSEDWGLVIPFRWISGGGMEPLSGMLSGQAIGLSADGWVVVGGSTFGDSISHAFRWTIDEGPLDLGTLPGAPWSGAYAISADGSTVVGASGSWLANAFRWTMDERMVDLGVLPGANYSGAIAASADGSVVVGESGYWCFDTCYGHQAFRWTSELGMQGLGGTPGAPPWVLSTAYGVSADGSVVVGRWDTGQYELGAAIWYPALPPLDLNEYLPTLGVDLTGWTLYVATCISADGRTIVGTGYHNGMSEAWIARVPLPADLLDSDGDSVPDASDTCPDSDLGATIIIDGCDTGVANRMPGHDGCSMTDLVWRCAKTATNHGEFVACVAGLIMEWYRDALLTADDIGQIQRCAAQAELPIEEGSGLVISIVPFPATSVVADCSTWWGGWADDPIDAGIIVFYDNTAGTAPARASVLSVTVEMTAPGLAGLDWDFAITPAVVDPIPAGETRWVFHTKDGSGVGNGEGHPCEYCLGEWRLMMTWDIEGRIRSETLDMSANCVVMP